MVVRLEASLPGTCYVAISHVWSDGLESHGNKISRCQFKRLSEMVYQAYHSHDVLSVFSVGEDAGEYEHASEFRSDCYHFILGTV